MAVLTSVQLYSLGSLPGADPAGVVARLANLGYDAVEPVLSTGASPEMKAIAASMGAEDLPSVDARALRAALDEHAMVAPSSHVNLPEGEVAQLILDEQEMLGSTYLVVPALFNADTGSIEAFDDRDAILRLADRFNAAADLARPRGIRIGYHNHFWEFGTDIDGQTGLEFFYANCADDIVAEIDVYWAQLGGQDPAELVRRLGDRVRLLHVKDGDGEMGTPSSPLGAGVVDLPAVLAAATLAEAHVVELEGIDEVAIWPALADARTRLPGLLAPSA